MNYLPISIIAYILNGFSLVVDKSLVDHSIKSPFVYTFYIGILSFLAIFLIPFGASIPNSQAALLAVLSGLIFTFGLITFFASLRTMVLTVVGPIVGTVNPVVALIIGSVLLNQQLMQNQWIGFLLLILGGLILTANLWWGKHSHDRQFLLMIVSGSCFGLSYVLLREAFLLDSFLNVLIISRVALTLVVLTFLLFPSQRQQIFASKLTRHHFVNKTSLLVITSQLAGGVSGLLVAIAVSLANPAIVNSIYGVQYIVLLGAVLILAKKYPHILDETITSKVLVQKIIAIVIIFLGLLFLAR